MSKISLCLFAFLKFLGFPFEPSIFQYAGEGCSVDHGSEFKKVKRSWVCAFLLDITFHMCMYYWTVTISTFLFPLQDLSLTVFLNSIAMR